MRYEVKVQLVGAIDEKNSILFMTKRVAAFEDKKSAEALLIAIVKVGASVTEERNPPNDDDSSRE